MDGSVEALPSIMTIRAARSAQPHATEHRDFGGADVCVMMMLLFAILNIGDGRVGSTCPRRVGHPREPAGDGEKLAQPPVEWGKKLL